MLSSSQFDIAMVKHKATEVMARSKREMNAHRCQDGNNTGCSTVALVHLHNILFVKDRSLFSLANGKHH